MAALFRAMSLPETPKPVNSKQLSMLIYNVTITLDTDIADQWVRWMTETHIPDIMMTGMFISFRMGRLLSHEHDDSEIFTVQYLAADMNHLQQYLEEFAPALQNEHKTQFEGKYAVFRTVMELVDHNEKTA
jgi:hypothetical protein